jgi:hypothetical protein
MPTGCTWISRNDQGQDQSIKKLVHFGNFAVVVLKMILSESKSVWNYNISVQYGCIYW